jgi:hypothetical protein
LHINLSIQPFGGAQRVRAGDKRIRRLSSFHAVTDAQNRAIQVHDSKSGEEKNNALKGKYYT